MESDVIFRENDAFGCMGHSESVMIKLMEKRLDFRTCIASGQFVGL